MAIEGGNKRFLVRFGRCLRKRGRGAGRRCGIFIEPRSGYRMARGETQEAGES